MKKSLFFKTTLLLLIGSLVSRSLGFIIRIIFTRIIGQDGINLYSLVMPTYSLFIALTQMGLPIAISTIIARGKTSGKKLMISITPYILFINIVMVILILKLSPFISINLLDNKDAIYPIRALALVLPFVSISSLLKGYFFGKQKMHPYTVSNAIEQIARLIIIIIFIPKLASHGYIYGVTGFIALSAISEFISIIVFLLYLPSKVIISKKDIKVDINITKDVFNLCIPTIGGRIFGNIAYFFEPIILLSALKYVGYSNSFFLNEYGVYNSYVLPLLMIPSFIVQSLSTALIPEISKSYAVNDIIKVKKRLKEAIILCLVVGTISNAIVFIFPHTLLKLIYNTTLGVPYIRLLAFFFVIYNLEGPLASALSALNHPRDAFKGASIGILIKTISLFLFSLLHIGIYGLIIGEILAIIITVYLNIKSIKKII